MIAEIVCVGTELLMGQVANTDAQFLARELSGLGITLRHVTVVGDNPERLKTELRRALDRADAVLTTGGLGPTVDDLTKNAAAELLGKELVLFPEAERAVREAFARMGRPMTENNLSQARFTADSVLFPNDYGTAPGAAVPAGEGKWILHFPGPPRELQPMFRRYAAPFLRRFGRETLVSRYIHIFGMGESTVDSLLRDLEEGGNPSLSPYCSTGEVTLRLTASGETEQDARDLLAPVEAEVRRRIGDKVYAVSDDIDLTMADCVIAALKARRWTVATCESLTGGLIAATLVNVSGASDVVRGGLVTYQSVAKTMLAGVPEELIETCNVVSAEVAAAMAEGARARLGVDIAVSATGLAGPGGGTPERPVGTVFLGLATAERTWTVPLRLTGDRARIRELTVKHALDALRRAAREKDA